jgi:PII-like signaling protein
MQCVCLRFYVREGMRLDGRIVHDWLFDLARECGLGGGSAFRASAGFGRHGLHEDSFFELAGELPETVEFIGSQEAIEMLLARVGALGARLMYVTYPVTQGLTGD